MGKSHLGHHHLIIEYLQIGVMELLNIKNKDIWYIGIYTFIRIYKRIEKSIYLYLSENLIQQEGKLQWTCRIIFTFSYESAARTNTRFLPCLHWCHPRQASDCLQFKAKLIVPADCLCDVIPLTVTRCVSSWMWKALTWQEYSPLSPLSARLITSWLPCSDFSTLLLNTTC